MTVSLVNAAQDIARADWQRLTPARHPFLNADFFSILERHQTAGPACGWYPHHLVARDGAGAVVGIAPTYVKSNSHGDFVRDWSWAAAYKQLGKVYYPKLLTALPHTPASGSRLLASDETVQRQLIAAGKELVASHQLSSWHIALPTAGEVALLASHGFLVSHDVQFQWRDHDYGDFDGFLGAFTSERRRKVKAQRRRVAESGLRIEVRHGDEIPPALWPDLYRIYASTFDKFGNYAAFSADCFTELGTTLRHQMVVFIAFDQAAPVAVSICFRSEKTLYGRYWGCIGDYHSLHFELCFYQGIAYCLREGLTTFEPGAGGEHKVARGFEPTVVRSCHWIADERMRQLIGRHLAQHQEGMVDYAAEAAQHLPFRLADASAQRDSYQPLD